MTDTMPVPTHLVAFWNGFVESTGGVDEARFYEAFFFGDSEALANELGELVLRGTKRATAGSVWSFEAEGKRLPAPGDLSIVTSWSGDPLCIIETRGVEVVPFSDVSAQFAAAEGEGDGSLSFWREAHRPYFARECARAGRQFTESMPVACERFDVVYRRASALVGMAQLMAPQASPILRSTLACPHCGAASEELMPADACVYFHECSACHKLLRPKAGDCCVFCSFGSVKCPPVQLASACCSSDGRFPHAT